MKTTIERVYEALNKVELKSEKIELGAIDDLDGRYKKIASEAPKIKNKILKLSSELSSVSNELDNLQENYQKLEGMAKELGANNIEKRAKKMFQVVGNLSGSWGSSAIKIETAAKDI
tara:strand:- start:69 stop:419 length:351 start_codon:yes stop_codon:yes gene_type:complete